MPYVPPSSQPPYSALLGLVVTVTVLSCTLAPLVDVSTPLSWIPRPWEVPASGVMMVLLYALHDAQHQIAKSLVSFIPVFPGLMTLS